MSSPDRPAAPTRHTLTIPKIVFVVVAAAAPLAAMVGTVPLAFAIGNGAGVPAAFAFAGLTLLCFSAGYAAMSRRIVNSGGFYTYMARGLGRPPAVAGGLVAVIAYNAATIGLLGAFGYFTALVAGAHGLHLPWQLWAAAGLALMALLGYRQIDISARLLALLMIGEVAILVLLDLAIVGRHGGGALPAASFSPEHAFGPGLGVGLMFAFISFIGFESATLYGEEARDPRRAVPAATYISVILIASFYAVTSWVAVGAIGVDKVVTTSGELHGDLFFVLGGEYLNGTAVIAMQVLLCTSLFAATLALHNAANRYMFVLGRERVLPAALGRVHHRHGSPHQASLVQSILTLAVCAVFALAGLDPYTNLATTMLALGTLGIVLLQAAAAASVLGFFRHDPERHWWRTQLGPALGLLGLIAATVLLVGNFSLVTGTTDPLVNALPWLMVVATVAGLAYAWWMRSARPERYARLAEDPHDEAPASTPIAPPVADQSTEPVG